MCTSKGADEVTRLCALRLDGEEHARLHRGGCYGLCDLGPNVVVRRYDNLSTLARFATTFDRATGCAGTAADPC